MINLDAILHDSDEADDLHGMFPSVRKTVLHCRNLVAEVQMLRAAMQDVREKTHEFVIECIVRDALEAK